MPFTQSLKYLREGLRYKEAKQSEVPDLKTHFLNYVLQNSPPNDPDSSLKAIDIYCTHYPMMNIGDEKSQIVKDAIKKYQPNTILELGGFVGYSAIMMAHASKSVLHTIQPNKNVAQIAAQIQQHCGLSKQIQIHIGTIQTEKDFILKHGRFDLIFIDHLKKLYLSDLKQLQQSKNVGKGTIVIGDNMIFPGSPEYLAYFKQNQRYDSTLYHSYLQYSDHPDAVLVSQCLK